METMTEFIFLVSKITADGDCSQEIKRHLLLGRKAMTKLDSQLKSRDITLPMKVRLVKAMVPVVTYGCESWTIKKAELSFHLAYSFLHCVKVFSLIRSHLFSFAFISITLGGGS